MCGSKINALDVYVWMIIIILKVPFFDALKSGPVETGQPYWLVEPWLASCSHLVCRCESGDLSNKHGQLSIASPGVGRPTYTYVDNNLYLMGTYTSEWMGVWS